MHLPQQQEKKNHASQKKWELFIFPKLTNQQKRTENKILTHSSINLWVFGGVGANCLIVAWKYYLVSDTHIHDHHTCVDVLLSKRKVITLFFLNQSYCLSVVYLLKE